MPKFVVLRTVLFLYLFFGSDVVRAEIWSCRTRDRSGIVYLDVSVPESSIESPKDRQECRPVSLRSVPFNKLNYDSRSRFTGHITAETPRRAEDAGNNVYTSWEARKLLVRRKKKRGTSEHESCEITGSARGKQSGPALVTVTRGALTVSQKEIRLKKDGAATAWRMVLKGSCRNPEVKIVRTD